MHAVFLDEHHEWAGHPGWKTLAAVPELTVERHTATTLPQLLERGRRADILVTTVLPLRREVLDYLTRPQHIVVPAGREAALVELPIAEQLGISVHPAGEPQDLPAIVQQIIAIAGCSPKK